jgi:hypothetical protein
MPSYCLKSYEPMNKTVLLLVLATLSLAPLRADVGETAAAKTMPEAVVEEEASTFSGGITAIEADRDSITVRSENGTIKMFSLAERDGYSVGDDVTISYADAYSWPLKVNSISKADAAK